MQDKIAKLKELVDLFNYNLETYKATDYKEASVRKDFIDKFFKLFDWDVDNEEGLAENWREVVVEDKLVIAGKPKAPDYSFRLGGRRVFFVEAKKPSVNIKESVEPAFQVRRYSYTAKLPISILTDFEEFAIYDTTIKPNKKDKPEKARIFYCRFDEYEKHFEFLHETLSKINIQKGGLDKYLKDDKRKRGTGSVDKEFLKLIDEWRNELARNIAKKNQELSLKHLNDAVQKIIDRIIFIRIAEDRNIEDYGTLQKLTEKTNIYPNLVKIFIKADEKYNSGLFKQEDLLNNLTIDDKVLIHIIKSLYYPDSPYEFSVLPVEVLGNIYEQFLGKTIRLTAGHQAKVEEKPEVRKAGGVYYTPQYIVDYIVENTIGEVIGKLGKNEKK